MGRILFLAIALVVALVNCAEAQRYYSNCNTGYCQPTYSSGYHSPSYSQAVTYPFYSKWEWTQWSGDPNYWIQVRFRHLNSFDKIQENDGWLYLRQEGYWIKHCLISDYKSKVPVLVPTAKIEQFGGTQVGYDPHQYAIVRQFPIVQPVLAQKELPFASSPQDFLAPYYSTGPQRVEYAHKSAMTAKELAMQVFQQEQQRESRQDEIRGQLALMAEDGRQNERLAAQLQELILAVKTRTPVSASAGVTQQVQVSDPELAAVIQENCLRCHGGGRVEKGIDFTKAQSFTKEQKYLCLSEVLKGEMPDEGTPLSEEKTRPFQKWYEDALLSGGK